MAQINGKQLLNSSVADGKLTSSYVYADGTRPLTADWAVGSFKLTGLTDGAAASQDAATVAQVEALIASDEAGLLDFLGDYNAATNSPNLDSTPVGTKKGDFYIVSVAGTFFTEDLEVGDTLFAKQDDPTLLSHWTRIQVNRGVDDVTIEIATNAYQLKDDGVSGAKLAPAVAGAGLVQDGSGNLDINVDNSSVEIATDTLQVKADGITGLMLAPAVAGAGLVQDGSGNLDVGAGSGITVNANDVQITTDGVTGVMLAPAVAGAGLAQDGSGNLDVGATDTSIVVAADAIRAAVPTASNKNMTASVTVSDNDQATATTVASAIAAGSYPEVNINGVQQLVGDGTKASVDCYFSNDAGVTARAFSAVAAADTLHWNGSVAGFELAATDRIDVNYNV